MPWRPCVVSVPDARGSHLDVVVLTQVGRLQVKVAEVEFEVEAVGDADVPAQLRLPGIRLGEVWGRDAAEHPRARQELWVGREAHEEGEEEESERKQQENIWTSVTSLQEKLEG